MESKIEEPFELVLPPAERYSVAVWKGCYQQWSLPEEVVWMVQCFLRPNRIEKLALHLYMILESGWREEVYWLQRQHRYLLQQLM